MKIKDFDLLIDDFFSAGSRSADPALAAVETALFIEDCFGFSVSDEDISPELMNSAESLRQYIEQKAGE